MARESRAKPLLLAAAMLALAELLAILIVGPAGAAPQPAVSGPVSGGEKGWPQTAAPQDLKARGYVEEEFFFAGTAHSYAPKSGTSLGSDGVWQVEPAGAARYKTRMLVRRPADPARFNGTVVVEWLQSHPGAAFDKSVYWIWSHEEILRGGYAWVGISADRGAVNGHPPDEKDTFPDLVHWDAQRYGSLIIPSEDLGYDIFTQGARLVGSKRANSGVDPMAGFKVERLISGSASAATARLVTYVNAVQPLEQVFDGFILHARMGSDARPLNLAVKQPDIVRLRTDQKAPVIVTNTEGEAPRHFAARQPDSAAYRLWEVTGAPHTNMFWIGWFNRMAERDFGGKPTSCDVPEDVPSNYVENAALTALVRWVKEGVPAPRFEPIAIVAGAKPEAERDALGNAKGGIRLPNVAVPASRFPGRMGCTGSAVPLTEAEFTERYGSREAWLAQFRAAVADAQRQGYLLPADGEAMLRTASSRTLPVAAR